MQNPKPWQVRLSGILQGQDGNCREQLNPVPARSAGLINQGNTLGLQFMTNAIGLGKIFSFAGCLALFDQGINRCI